MENTMQINMSEIINLIQNSIMRTLLKDWNPHGGWDNFLTESIESASRYHIIRYLYSKTEQQYKVNAVLNFFHQKKHWEYKINFKKKVPIEHLADVLRRGVFITNLFNETYNGLGTGLFLHVRSLDWDIFQLENDKELERETLQSLLDSIVRIDYHDKVGEAIADEICNQIKELPSEAQDLLALTYPKDTLTSQIAFESLLKKSFQKARYINLPDIARDKKWCILGLIENRRRWLQEQSIWNQLQWIEKKGKYTVDDILQELQDEKQRQYAKKRSPHRVDNKEYLDEEKLKSDGSKVSTLDILTAKSESLQTQPLEIEEGFTQEQRQKLVSLLGKTGLKIFEYRYQYSESVGREGENKEIANALGIAESTVGRYVGTKKSKGILETKADEIIAIIYS